MNLRSCPPVATWTPLPPDPPTAPPAMALPVRLASKICLDCPFQNFCLDWSGHRILLCVGVARRRAGLPRGCRGATREERLGRCEGGSGGRLGHCVGMRPCARAPVKPQAGGSALPREPREERRRTRRPQFGPSAPSSRAVWLAPVKLHAGSAPPLVPRAGSCGFYAGRGHTPREKRRPWRRRYGRIWREEHPDCDGGILFGTVGVRQG